MKVTLDQKLLMQWLQKRNARQPCPVDVTALPDVQLIHLAGLCLGLVARLDVDRGLVGDIQSAQGAEIAYDAALLQRAAQTASNVAATAIDLFQDPSQEIFFLDIDETEIDDQSL